MTKKSTMNHCLCSKAIFSKGFDLRQSFALFGIYFVGAFSMPLWSDETPSSVDERMRPAEIKEIEGGGDVLSVDEILVRLDKFYIPEMKFQDALLKDVITSMKETVRERGPGKGKKVKLGFEIVLRDLAEIGFDLECSNIPLKTALEYACSMSGVTYEIKPGAIVIFPRTHSGDSYVRIKVFDVPDALDKSNWLDSGEPGVKKTAQRYFEELGIIFPEGSSIIYNEINSDVTVIQTISNLELIEKHLNLFEKSDEEPTEDREGR